jgi:pyruvate dehydrogenase E1 component beta subunit
MAIQILMPALSPTMEEGTLAKWLIKEGDIVASGDIIAEIETDKATMEFEAVDEGVIGKLLVAEGTKAVQVNAPIAMLLEEGERSDAVDIDVTVAVAQPVPSQMAEIEPASIAPAAPAEPAMSSVPVVPDWPEGTPIKQQSVREALRDAMVEEMTSDPTVYLMGEEVGEYQGAYKVPKGCLRNLAINV